MIVCIIPARLNSTRFPKKLLQMAGGKTILQRTFECAIKCKSLDLVFVATDSDEIASHVESFHGKVIRTTSSCQNGTERIIDALERNPELQQAEVIVNLQGDHPVTSPLTLEKVAALLIDDPKADMGTAVRKIRSWEDYRSPHVVKCVFDQGGRALYFSRSPIPYVKNPSDAPPGFQHIGIYAYRPLLLSIIKSWQNTDLQRSEDLEQLQLLERGCRIKVALVEDEAIGIDTPQDLAKLEKFL